MIMHLSGYFTRQSENMEKCFPRKVKIWRNFKLQTACIFVINKYTVFTIVDTVSQIIMTGEIQVYSYAWHFHLLYAKLSSNVGTWGMWVCSFFLSFKHNSQLRHVNHSAISDQSDRWWWNHHCNDTIFVPQINTCCICKKEWIY